MTIAVNWDVKHQTNQPTILKDFSIGIDTIRLGLSILYFKGSQVEISKT